MTKTLADMEERIQDIEKNMARNTTIEKHAADFKTDMEGKLEAVNVEVAGLKTALVKAFDEMKGVLITMETGRTRGVVNRPSGDRENNYNIIVAGGTNSVEMFNWRQRTWSPLQSLKKYRYGATSFIYNDHMTIAGGTCGGSDDDMIRMNVGPNPDPLTHWNACAGKLPAKLRFHSSVLYNDQLIVTGGYGCGNRNVTSDLISEVQLVPPYAVKTLSKMPEKRQNHSMEIFDDNVLIVGGRTSGAFRDNLGSVLMYDLKKNELKQLSPLPYEVSNMATVRWGDNIVVIGGDDTHDRTLDKVIIYNVLTEQSHMLPPMSCKRRGCTAVVVANNIVVLGGSGDQGRLKSVECFNFERYTWEELPEMSKARFWHTAVVV
ncbi:kelch-like protein 40b [Dendronephthya gigantea]|uniref:kelch-like protein 40b n=1 Tax=Dendronephthya gigantea TaxID=151771 RepID=UPI00106DCF1B|nr:kelch-like protein 40b [Dendronephthya gigantea]